MKKFDFRTPMIYILTSIIVILLIIMKKMDDENFMESLKKNVPDFYHS